MFIGNYAGEKGKSVVLSFSFILASLSMESFGCDDQPFLTFVQRKLRMICFWHGTEETEESREEGGKEGGETHPSWLIVVVVPRSTPRERRSVSSSRSSVSVTQERELRYREPGFLKVFSGVVANLLASAKRRVSVWWRRRKR